MCTNKINWHKVLPKCFAQNLPQTFRYLIVIKRFDVIGLHHKKKAPSWDFDD